MHSAIKELIQHSIEIIPGLIAVWPQFDKEEELYPVDTLAKFEGNHYATNNSTIAFCYPGHLFATPYTSEAITALEEAGFEQSSFYVPFSNGDYPKYAATRWKELRKNAHESYLVKSEQRRIAWAKEHGINALDERVIKHAFRVPDTGLPIHHWDGRTEIYYGECPHGLSEAYKIGKFCRNRSSDVIFVNCDGHTYFAGEHIVKYLIDAGYTETSMDFPVALDDTIPDKNLAHDWERTRDFWRFSWIEAM